MAVQRIIVVDDDTNFLSAIKRNLERYGIQIDTYSDSIQALNEIASSGNVDLLILDLTMPEFDGVELMLALAQRNCPTPILLISGWWPETLELSAILGSAHGLRILGTLQKPFNLDQIVSALKGGLPMRIF